MMKIFKIPLRARDEVVSMIQTPFPWHGGPEVLVVTKEGRLYSITRDEETGEHYVEEAGGKQQR